MQSAHLSHPDDPLPSTSSTHPVRVYARDLPLVLARGADPLVRALALDRLRDLRDDGLTYDYIGRMYEVDADMIRHVEKDLRRL